LRLLEGTGLKTEGMGRTPEFWLLVLPGGISGGNESGRGGFVAPLWFVRGKEK